LRDYIVSLPIKNVYLNTFAACGTDKNPDKAKGLVWEHFYLKLPSVFVKPDIGPIQANALGNKEVLERSLNEITDDAVESVIELINQGSLYRGSEFKGMVEEFNKIKTRYKKVKGAIPKNNFCWLESVTASPAVTRIKNSAIGTLLNNLSEGMELDSAVSAFEKVVAPTNYKRSTALVTPRMIDDAKKKLEELGLTGALYRRMLNDSDLNVNNTLFVHRASNIEGDIFEQMKKDTVVNPKTLSKIEEIGIDDFIKKVLPKAKSIKALVENKHLSNFCSLVGSKDKDSGNLFKWSNDSSWSYSGQVADSMRARVAELGGRVDGVLRFTHSWNHPEMGRNASLMDLHVFMPGSSSHKDGCHNTYPSGQRVGWNNRKDHLSGGVQDVDYTDAAPEKYIPIENISFPSIKNLKDGKYIFKIHNWSLRAPTNSGFKAEIEFAGQIFRYVRAAPLKHQEWITLAEVTLKNGVFEIEHKMESTACSQKKWEISTERFHAIKAITLSPNHWQDKSVGNKHFLFFLEGCVSDESPRGFYNEMLKESLMPHRKVFEVLAGKIQVESTKNELSGLGFSETVRNDIVLEVQGAFKRLIRVKF